MIRLAPSLPLPVLLIAIWLTLFISGSSANLVLNEKIMKLVRASAELSVLAYSEDPNTEYQGNEFGTFGFWDEEPDQSIVAPFQGYCIGSFRGTTMQKEDWVQNFDLGTREICDNHGDCCRTREGFYKAYYTDYVDEFEASLRDCAKGCTNPDECVVLTGHSQGGAIAAVAGVVLADLNPYVFTFGQPRTILEPCEIVQSSRWIRFINTKTSPLLGIVYDPIPFVPGLGADGFGHVIMLSDDRTGVAYIGRDVHEFFHPLDPAGLADAHSMGGGWWSLEHPGYLDRIRFLMENATYPIRSNGYVAGSLCSKDKECETGRCESETAVAWSRCVGDQCTTDEECDTGRCDSGICIPKLGTCMHCDEDSDCAGPSCYMFRCTNENDLMDDNCVCGVNSDCESGRCEGFFPPICEATKVAGAKCNEDSDCMSGACSWRFRCEEDDDDAASVEEDGNTKARTGMNGDDSTTGSQLQHHLHHRHHHRLLVTIVILLILTAGYFGTKYFAKWRQGYEEVPTNLMV